jgi:hypothetical protein
MQQRDPAELEQKALWLAAAAFLNLDMNTVLGFERNWRQLEAQCGR